MEEKLSKSLQENQTLLDEKIGVGRNFDVIARDLLIGGTAARMYVIDGYGDDGTIERIVSFLLQVQDKDMEGISSMDEVIRRFVTFGEVNAEGNVRNILTGVFLGKMALVIEGFDQCALIDAKTFPGRGIQEPTDGRVLRGAHVNCFNLAAYLFQKVLVHPIVHIGQHHVRTPLSSHLVVL